MTLDLSLHCDTPLVSTHVGSLPATFYRNAIWLVHVFIITTPTSGRCMLHASNVISARHWSSEIWDRTWFGLLRESMTHNYTETRRDAVCHWTTLLLKFYGAKKGGKNAYLIGWWPRSEQQDQEIHWRKWLLWVILSPNYWLIIEER